MAHNIKLAREARIKGGQDEPTLIEYKVGDRVLLKDHTAKSMEPKYKSGYNIKAVISDRRFELVDAKGKTVNVHRKDIKMYDRREEIADQMNKTEHHGRRSTTAALPVSQIPDLNWTEPREGPYTDNNTGHVHVHHIDSKVKTTPKIMGTLNKLRNFFKA